MAFGQETGRVLSDGRVVGRAEPFAKVFRSSRLVKRAVGLTAWAILEDIALDDVEGRLVAETSTRRISANLGINRETVGATSSGCDVDFGPISSHVARDFRLCRVGGTEGVSCPDGAVGHRMEALAKGDAVFLGG